MQSGYYLALRPCDKSTLHRNKYLNKKQNVPKTCLFFKTKSFLGNEKQRILGADRVYQNDQMKHHGTTYLSC